MREEEMDREDAEETLEEMVEYGILESNDSGFRATEEFLDKVRAHVIYLITEGGDYEEGLSGDLKILRSAILLAVVFSKQENTGEGMEKEKAEVMAGAVKKVMEEGRGMEELADKLEEATEKL